MPKLFFPGNAGDMKSVLEGRASGGLIIEGENIIIIDPGIGFIVKSQIKHADTILCSEDNPLYNNDKKILEETFKTKNIDDEIEAIDAKYAKAFLIKTNKFILGYIAKAQLTKKLAEEFKDTNILVIHTTQEKDYLKIEDMINIIEYVNPELVILTGFSHNIDPLEFSRHVKKELQKYSSKIMTQIIPAREQTIINTDAYNIKLKQKSLKGFM
jgi:hypothetical protein